MNDRDDVRLGRLRALLPLVHSQLSNCHWHWFKYHFFNAHPFARSMLNAIVDCDMRIDGFGKDFIASVTEIADKEMDLDHLDQLMQRMAELLVIRRFLDLEIAGATYAIEPTAGKSKKRPDLVIDSEGLQLVIEIKAPAVTKLTALRDPAKVQLVSRLPADFGKPQEKLPWPVVLPRDNAVKDFLISASDKFKSFKEAKECVTLLVIVWDDFIQEVISALAHPVSGLLTPNSFAKSGDGAALTYPHMDGVIIVRHLTYFVRATDKMDIEDRTHAFDFGGPCALPNVFVPNPAAPGPVPNAVLELLRAIPLGDERINHAAEYRPKDLIFWI